MIFNALTIAALLAAGANAHFRLLFPEPRGPFVDDNEPDFCGGYNDVTANKTVFPLQGGFFLVRQSHENWTASVLISTVANPNGFEDFSSNGTIPDQYLRYWANEPKAGNFCVPLNFTNTGIAGVEDGADVTIQVAFAGSDGDLYQCADLTLSANATISAADQAACVNTTSSEDHGGNASSSGAPSPSESAKSGSVEFGSFSSSVPLGLAGFLFAVAAAL